MDKKPVDPRTFRVYEKDSNWLDNPECWVSHEVAYNLARLKGLNVGFVFTVNDPFFFVDIDGCKGADNQWTPLALNICEQFRGCAVEVSQSGQGLHIFGTYPGDPGPHRNREKELGLELYTSRRFVALGQQGGEIGDAGAVAGRQLGAFIRTYMSKDTNQADGPTDWTDGPCAEWSGPEDDDVLLALMLRSRPSAAAAFGSACSVQELWEADEDALGKAFPPDPGNNFDPFGKSEANAALLLHLAFWTGRDCERMWRLFQRSKLWAYSEDKWGDREDYFKSHEIQGAARMCGAVYKKPDEAPPPPPSVEAKESAVATATMGGTGEFKTGVQFLGVDQQLKHFAGCVYVRDLHKVFVPDGGLLKPEQFKAEYGGYIFPVDNVGDKTERNAFTVFTESQAVNFPKAHGVCFRPTEEPGSIIEEEGRRLINTYIPIKIRRLPGDPSPALGLLAKMVPNELDRAILIAYMAAVIQFPGVKFQWAPVLQGVEGNGKTFFIRALRAAIGRRYSHIPNASQLGTEAARFNAWIQGKLFIGVEEIWVRNRAEVANALKEPITNDELELQGKGDNQVMGDNFANWFMCSNHKDAVMKTKNDRRYCCFYTAQQSYEDLVQDGMIGDYFPDLYDWLKADGAAIFAEYLATYDIPDELNPATRCTRAPTTTSTEEAIELSQGSIEQEIQELIDQGESGFCGGWVSSMALDRALRSMGKHKALPPKKRREVMQSLGYDYHPSLNDGRVNRISTIDQGKPRLYVKLDHGINVNLPDPGAVISAYERAQGPDGGVSAAEKAFGGGGEVKVTKDKNCYCHTCERWFHYLGINRHTAMHRDMRERCKVTYTYGDTYIYKFDEMPKHGQ
jgi:hypothetical protein